MESQDQAPNCFQCAYFQATYDPRTPRACRKFGFKCKNMPSLEIFANTGNHCIFFAQKEDIEAPVEHIHREGSSISMLG